MKRKVIQIAGSTQLVSLPRQWAKRQNIQKGDEIEVEEQGDKLVISTGKVLDSFTKTEIDVTNLDPVTQRILHALYKRGYDEVIIKYANPKVLDIIQRMLHDSTIGYEIVEQKKNHCVIRAVAGVFDKEFDTILRRTFLLSKSLIEGLAEAIENGDTSQLSTLRRMESGNNKYAGFCRRIINKSGLGTHWKTSLTYALVEELEKVADEGKYLCDYLLESEKNIKKANKKIKQLYRELAELFSSCYALYYTFDIDKTVDSFIKRKRLIKDAHKFLNKSCEQTRFAHHLLTMTQQIANMLSFEIELSL